MPAYNRKIEALAEAITKFTGYQDPASNIHAARNPGALMAFLPEQARDNEGHRVFASVLDGYQALLHDLAKKVSGTSRHNLDKDSTLVDLARVRNEPTTIARSWSLFLRSALRDPSVKPLTTLSYFTE